MALKFKLASLEGLAEGVAALYEKHEDGNYYLAVEGAVAKSKVDEFRENNVKLSKELDRFKDIDLEEIATLRETVKKIEGKKTITTDKLDELVAEAVGKQTKAMKTEYETQIANLTKTSSTQSRQLESLLIDNKVREAATGNKVLGSAVDDVLLRAKSVFKLKDGVAVPYDSDGNIQYSKDGSNPMSVGDWVLGLSKTASHLFEGSQGGGSGGGGGGGGGGAKPTTPLGKISAGLQNK